MPADVAICGYIVDPGNYVGKGCLELDGKQGVIKALTRTPEASKVFSFYDPRTFIAPGFIDMHTHLRGLKLAYKEDEATGSLEAVRSGVTLVADMPNTVPRLDNVEAVEAKLEALKASSYTDYVVYAAIPEDPAEVVELAETPIVGFKVYPEDLYSKRDSVKQAARLRKLVVLHAEHEAALKAIMDSEEDRGIARGCWAEVAAVDDLATIKPYYMHVTHVSCPQTLLKAKSLGATVDITVHHLLYPILNPNITRSCEGRVNPPLRHPVTALRLLSLLAEGFVDAIASDHAPHSHREKLDPVNCSPGFCMEGVWVRLASCLAVAGLLSIEDIVRLLSKNPARILGLTPFYGSLRPGSRANITVFTLGYMGFTSSRMYSKCENLVSHVTPSCILVRLVTVGGTVVVENEKVIDKPEPVNAVDAANRNVFSPP